MSTQGLDQQQDSASYHKEAPKVARSEASTMSREKREEEDEEQAPADPVEPSNQEPVSPYHPSQFPDGGSEAWLCLLGAFCCLFCSFGWLNCIGVFQAYYQTHQLRDYSPSDVAWIPSLEIFMMFIPGPIVGHFFDKYGPRYLLFFGTFFHVFGLMMTSLCTEYWQFVLAQGVCSPLGLNCIFNAGMTSVTTWFFKKRGLAFGAAAAGSGLGGVIYPIMTSHLIDKVGYGWALRIDGFLILGLCCIAILTVKSRLPPRNKKFELREFLSPFKDIRFVVLGCGSFLFFLALFIPINYIEVQALESGMSRNLASYLIPILNAASMFGRVIPGALGDKVGRYNMQIVMSYFAAILVLALWLPSSGNAAYITFAGFYGFASGAFVALCPAQIAQISPIQNIGARTGLLFAVLSIAGLVGSPIAGQIVIHEHGKFRGLQIFSGVILLAGATIFIFARATLVGFKFAKI